jgi:peptidyl-prolyl cis-trans isomerase-like 2
LDGKHTIFGKLVGGFEVLTEMERIEVDNKDTPVEDIIIERTQVFVDPFQEADEQLAQERKDDVVAQEKEEEVQRKKKEKPKSMTVFRAGVGKYLDTQVLRKTGGSDIQNLNDPPRKRKKEANYNFGSFSGW